MPGAVPFLMCIALHQSETQEADLSGCSADCFDKVAAVYFMDKDHILSTSFQKKGVKSSVQENKDVCLCELLAWNNCSIKIHPTEVRKWLTAVQAGCHIVFYLTPCRTFY
jgi:hypothetical protein